MHITREYDVIAYRQSRHSKARLLLSFVVAAEELLEWAGIPRRADDRLIGFQRPDDPERVAAAKEFFNTGPNQSPTALIVGIHHGSELVSLELFGDEKSPLRHGKLRVKVDSRTQELTDILHRVKSQLQVRLSEEPPDAPESPQSQELGAADLPDSQLDEPFLESSSDEDETVDEVEIGSSIINRLLERMDDADWVAKNEEHLREISKPATIIDGQHRLLGAAECERKIPFQVCAIYQCPWEEQVFQFTIVNYKQKGIPDQFITANAALSLTKSELGRLQERLVQAQVKVVEYELMKTVQFDDRSPFFSLVNLTEKAAPNLIGYKTMVRIANGWYQANAPFFHLLLTSLYRDITGKGAKSRRKDRWKDGDWSDFFIDYWDLVKSNYGATPSHVGGHSLWEVGYSQLMVAIVLLEFQNTFFQSLSDQDEEFFDVSNESNPVDHLRAKLKKRALKLFESFPSELFATKWKETSLNTGPGRSSLHQVFDEMKKNKGNWNWKNSTLVKGQS